MADLTAVLTGFRGAENLPAYCRRREELAGTVYAGALLKRTDAAATVVVSGGDDSACQFAGVALQSGTSGQKIEVATEGVFGPYTHDVGSLDNNDIGAPVYMGTDDNHVTDQATATNDQPIGVIHTVHSATIVDIKIDPAIAGVLRYTSKVNSDFGLINLGLFSARIVDGDGDVGAIAVASGNGGALASDTDPVLEANGGTNAQQLRWAATSVVRIAFDPVALPRDFDDTAAAYVDLFWTSAGTTNAPTATVVTNWNAGADVSDTATGAAQTAFQTASATVAASDIPASSRTVGVSITPSAHGTDAWQLHGAAIRYRRKAVEA